MPASQHQNPKSDIEISQAAKKRPIIDIAKEKLGISAENLDPYGHYKAKVSMDFVKSLKDRKNVLTIDLKPIVEARGESGTIKKLAASVGYRPIAGGRRMAWGGGRAGVVVGVWWVLRAAGVTA